MGFRFIQHMSNYDIKQEMLNDTDQFVWSPQFSVGHPELDSQHRHLMKITNRLIALSRDPSPSAMHYDHLLEEIGEYLRLHLLYEERLMSSIDYPDLNRHRNGHAQIMIKMSAYLAAGKVKQLPEVVAFMREWLLEHILVEDMKLKGYL